MKILLFLASVISICLCFRQEFTFYKETNATGDSVTLRSKRPDLVPLAEEIITGHKSRCYRGLWRTYATTNYTVYHSGGFQAELTCFNSATLGINSSRYIGPEDTDIESITFTEGINFVGEELIVTSQAYAGIGFDPQSLFTTGWSNWSFYSDPNFQGTGVCYRSTQEMHNIVAINVTLGISIKSVAKGCNGRIDTVLYAGSLETQPLQPLQP